MLTRRLGQRFQEWISLVQILTKNKKMTSIYLSCGKEGVYWPLMRL